MNSAEEGRLGREIQRLLPARSEGYLVEAANARHEHEYAVWDEAKLPEGKILVPGGIETHAHAVANVQLGARTLVAGVPNAGPLEHSLGAIWGGFYWAWGARYWVNTSKTTPVSSKATAIETVEPITIPSRTTNGRMDGLKFGQMPLEQAAARP